MTTPAKPPQGDGDDDAVAGPAADPSPHDAAAEQQAEPGSGNENAPGGEPGAAPGPDAGAATPAAAAEAAEPAPDDADSDSDTGTAGDAESSAGGDTGSGNDTGADVTPEGETVAAAGKPPRRRHWLRITAIAAAVVVLAGAGGVYYVYQHLNGNITTDTRTEAELSVHASERPTEGPTKAENILLIGSDNRGNGNTAYGHDTGTQRSDTTILLHLAADRSSATAVSIPRDLMAHVPACRRTDGSMTKPKFEQFNWAFQFGGAACTIRTVENMTHIRVDHHLIVDFTGFKKMVDAVGGVEVCVSEPVHDTDAQLDLPAGEQKLNGEQALGYVRARESIGDGSDTGRMDRQQDFLASLVKKVRSNGVLLNPVKLYPLLSAATSSLTADPGLDSLSELYGLAHSLQQTPTGSVRFLTLPQEPYVNDHNRDQLVQPAADTLFTTLREDRPVAVTARKPAHGGATATPTTGAGPTYRGTTADRALCGAN